MKARPRKHHETLHTPKLEGRLAVDQPAVTALLGNNFFFVRGCIVVFVASVAVIFLGGWKHGISSRRSCGISLMTFVAKGKVITFSLNVCMVHFKQLLHLGY